MNTKEQQIKGILKERGISPSLLGYYCLTTAVELIMNDFSLINKITTKLYPQLAKNFWTTAPRIERRIRHAVQTGWSRGNKELQDKMFGYTVDAQTGCPTNGEFVTTVADYLAMLEEESGANDA